MAIWAIGDVHGCRQALERLVDRLAVDPAVDELWMVGDLVNRGPDSLGVLRWARDCERRLGDRLRVVLGNHDLHLLAAAAGLRKPKPRDTLEEVLQARDREELLEWLRRRPLIHRRGATLLVHAGLLPEWSARRAQELARRVERRLRSLEGVAALLDGSPAGAELAEERSALAAMTRLRLLRADGSACDFAGPPEEAPAGCTPWFEMPGRRSAHLTVVAGHWAALGLRLQPGLVALDSGCVWGGELTAVRLDDRKVVAEPASGGGSIRPPADTN